MSATRRVEYESAEWRQLREAGWCEELIYLPDDGGEAMALMRAPAPPPGAIPTAEEIARVEAFQRRGRVASLEEIAADLEALGPTGSAP